MGEFGSGINPAENIIILYPFFSFLFGTCCQLGNKLENSILDDNTLDISGGKQPATNAAAISYETYGGANFEDQNALNQKPNFMVPTSAVNIESASPASVNYDKNKHSTYLPSPSPTPYLPPSSSSQPFSSELPTFISPTKSAVTTQKVDYITENSLNKLSSSLLLHNENLRPPFTHSSITHGEADAVILDVELPTADQFYGQSAEPTSNYGFSSTPLPTKVTFAKPAFKPKPTTVLAEPTTNKYVLVHTISNDRTEKPPTPTTNIESIESIILMLNETKAGSQYSTVPVEENLEHRETTTSTSQTRYPTTSSINYDKYGATSFYITTKLPAPTKIPNKASSPALTYTVSSSLDFQNSVSPARPTQTPAKTTIKTTTKTTPKPLVTSYISSTVIPKRPTAATTNIKKGQVTKKQPTKRPSSTSGNLNTVKVTQSTLVTKQPTKSPYIISSSTQSTKVTPTHTIVSSRPTVILIGPPKDSPQHPILSIVHEDTVQISGGAITDRPHPTVHITPKPVNNSVSTVSYDPIPTRIHSPAYGSTPFVTKRPVSGPTAPVIYEAPSYGSTLADTYNSYYTPTTIVSTTSIYSSEHLDTHYYDEGAANEKPSGSDDGADTQQNDDLISFPPVRHPNLNMSGEVYDQKPLNAPVFIEDEKLNNKMNLLVSKIVASLQGNFENLEDLVNEANVTTSRPLNTRRPVQAVTRRPTTTTGRPPQRTTTRPRTTTTTKRPLRITTTTRKPTTRRPATVAAAVTRKPSPKPTTRRPKPTRKATTTTTTSTTVATLQEEEYVGEVGEDYEEETAGELEQGRIRKC